MFSLIIAILFLGLGLIGVILSLSGISNNYQKKKIEYLSYKNQLNKQSRFSPTAVPDQVQSEEEYYKAHDAEAGVIDLNFVISRIPPNLLSLKTYRDFTVTSWKNTVAVLREADYALWWSKIQIIAIKLFKLVRRRAIDTFRLIVSLSQPVDDGKKSPTIADLSKMPSLGFKGQEIASSPGIDSGAISNASPEPIVDPRRSSLFQKRDTATAKSRPQPGSSTRPADSNHDIVYKELETELLGKLQNNMDNLSIWESLGNFYQTHTEFEKAKEVFGYVLEHSQSTTQKSRIRKKLAE